MATRVVLPMITRKKIVPSKYDPNTFRVVCYNEDSHEKKYPDLCRVIRAQDPLGACANKRPDILSYCTKVLPEPLFDYRANRPYRNKCGFLRQNYRMYNEPICYMKTDGQPEGHWIAPTLHQEDLPQPPYRPDTISRKDFSDFSHQAMHADKRIEKDKRESYKLRAPWEKTVGDLSEKISYEQCYDCREKKNYPIRGKIMKDCDEWRDPSNPSQHGKMEVK